MSPGPAGRPVPEPGAPPGARDDTDGTPSTDGRVARRDRNRVAVIDAAIAFFSEGLLDPDPELVAARCGLSPRSVYRYFEDREGLLRAAIERHFERTAPLAHIHAIGEGPLDDRVERFVDTRLGLYEAVAHTARAARRRAATSDIIREQVGLTRRQLREQIDRHFEAELRALAPRSRASIAAAVDTLCQFEGLDHYRVHLGCSPSETNRMLRDALHRLLDPLDPPGPRHDEDPDA